MSESVPPVIDFTTYVAERSRRFTGRGWLLQQFDDWLTDSAAPRVFLLNGEPGAGKTALAARLAQLSAGTAPPPPGLSRIRPGFLGAVHFCSVRDRRWINPHVFAESLTRQLSDRYDGYALAVLRNIAPTVNITLEVRENWGRVIGAEIGTLVVTAAPEDVFDRLVREPLEALSRIPTSSGSPEQVVILVDALDEALTYSGQVTIADLVAQTDNLPSNVRFILTCRPSNDLLRTLRRGGAAEATLSPRRSGSDQVLHDVQDYLERIIDEGEPPLRDSLDLPVDEFVATVRDRSEGNFLYVRHLLLALSGRIGPASLAAAPTGLDQIYLEFLQRLSGNDLVMWQAQYGKVLGMLAVAQVPLTEHRIAEFTGLPLDGLRPVLARIRQLLETDSDQPATERAYALYHRSFGEFLLSPARAEDYWVNRASMHKLIARYYLDNFSSNWHRSASYGLRNLATHLYEAGLTLELQELIDEQWIRVRHRRRNYSYDGLLDDLDLAWRAAAELNRRDLTEGRSPRLGQEVRWALCVSSIASLVQDIPPDVLAALVGTGAWSTDQGRSHARRTPAGESRSRALAMLAPHLPNPVDTYQEALAAADQITEAKRRAGVLTWLLPQLPVALRGAGFVHALNAIDELSDQRRIAGGYGSYYASDFGERFVETGERTRASEALAEAVSGLLDPPLSDQALSDLLRFDQAEQLAARLTAEVMASPWPTAAAPSTQELLGMIDMLPGIGDDDLLDQVKATYRVAAPPPRLELTQPSRPAQLPDVLDLNYNGTRSKTEVRLDAAVQLSGSRQQEAVDGILATVHEHGWWDYSTNAPWSTLKSLDLVAQLPESDQRTELLGSLAGSAIARARSVIYGRGHPGWNARRRIALLLGLMPHLPEPHLSEASQALLHVVVEDFADQLNAEHTAVLAWYLPEGLLTAAEPAITEVPLPHLLPAERLPAALAVARARKNKDWLLAITRRLTGPALVETLVSAEEIGGVALRAELLGRCAANYLTLDPVTLYEVWSAGLQGLANLPRGTFLELLRGHRPIVAALGGTGSLTGVVEAVEDVRKWWP
jgi:hypothetical protein